MILGENGIATRAKESAQKTDLASAQEAMNLAVSAAQTDYFSKFAEDISVGNPNFTIGEIQEHLEGYFICNNAEGEVTAEAVVISNGSEYYVKGDAASIAKYQVTFELTDDGNIASAVVTEVTGSNRTLTGGQATYKNPIIPAGFEPVDYGASWTISGDEITGWNDGLVIEDEKGNQFVWVPIDGTNVPYAKWCTTSISYTKTTGDDLPIGITETNQITKYGGFWIGRYEAGRSDVDTATTATNNVSSGVELLIREGAQPWNLISYTNAKKVAESYVNNINVKSGLVTGTQWDSVAKWVENAGYDVSSNSTSWGNYYTNTSVAVTGRYSTSRSNTHVWQTGTFSKSGNKALFTGTGIYETAKSNNIYDLAGNMYEWTAEQYSNNFIVRAGSGDYGSTDPVAFRDSVGASYTHYVLGFRVVLYVM